MAIREDEAVIQQAIVIAFNNKFCLKHQNPRLIIHSIPNGITADSLPPKERGKVLDKMNKTGMLPGAADLNIKGVLGRVLEVEVKTSTGSQSPEQVDYQKRITELGGHYILVRSVDDFLLKINPFLDWLLGK